jgi:hypothetical protein
MMRLFGTRETHVWCLHWLSLAHDELAVLVVRLCAVEADCRLLRLKARLVADEGYSAERNDASP